jgi:hypothetical protein
MKSTRINIRLSHEDKARWEAAAFERDFRSLAAYITDLVEQNINPKPKFLLPDLASGPEHASEGPRERPISDTPAWGKDSQVLKQPDGRCPKWFHHRRGAYCHECGVVG